MLSEVINFLHSFFVLPVLKESVHYNIYNTAVYALVFALTFVYIVPDLLERAGVKKSPKFFLSLTPWVMVFGGVRALKDAGVVNSIMLETPLIFVWSLPLLVGLTGALYRYQGLENDVKHQIMGASGLLLLVPLILLLQTGSYAYLFGSLISFLVSALGWFLISEKILASQTIMVFFSFSGQLWDASTSMIAVSAGAEEKHVVAGFFMDLVGPGGIFLVKTLLVLPAVLIIDRYGGEESVYYLGIIGLLGVALGTRNLLSLLAV